MKKLMKNKKGFTLMEMLIVVAIIVILVAISIPVFTSQLNNAKQATDDANKRAAKGVATTMYLAGEFEDEFSDTVKSVTYYYDAENGELVDTTKKPETYGQIDGDVVKVTITDGGDVTVEWE